MGKTKEVKYEEQAFEVDDTIEETILTAIPKESVEVVEYKNKKIEPTEEAPIINVLRNERVVIRHIPKEGGSITNPKHVLYGGMAEAAVRYFVVPRLTSGAYVNVLTNEEKVCLEQALGLEYNALSIYKKKDNFWENRMVRLTKQDNFLDLSDPNQYIDYKILLANKDFIAPSLQSLQDCPKATYQFVIIAEGEENKKAKDSMSATMKCYKEYGKIEEDRDTLRVIIETLDGRPTAANTKLEFLQTKINNLIQADSKLFLKVITDPYLKSKVLIKKAVEVGAVINRDNHFYLREDNFPLCEANEEATLGNAAKFINNQAHQNIMFVLQAKVKE